MNEALARHSKLAFRRMRRGAAHIKRFHNLSEAARHDAHLKRVCQWLVVPFSLWPVDIIGVADCLISLAESGERPGVEILALIEMLGELPKAKTCDSVCAHEHDVKGGNYETLIKAQHKFNFKEELLKAESGFPRGLELD